MKNNIKFTFERNVNQTLIYNILGTVVDHIESTDFENDTFIIRNYWNHEEDNLPNFEHKASGFKLWWYKYPLRSCESNMEISHEQFWDILYDCSNSITAGKDFTPYFKTHSKSKNKILKK